MPATKPITAQQGEEIKCKKYIKALQHSKDGDASDRDDGWKVFLEVLRNKPDLHAKPEEVMEKLAAPEAAIKREKGMSTDAPLFTKSE